VSEADRTAERRIKLVGYGLSATGAVLFATKGVLIKLIYRYGIDTTTLLALRMAFSAPFFIVVGLAHWVCIPRDARPNRQFLVRAAAIGVLGYYISAWLDLHGLQTLDAQLERLILFTYPLLVILFGWLLFKGPLSIHALTGAGLSYVGLFVMFAAGPQSMTPAVLRGGGLVAMSAACFALYQLIAYDLIRRLGSALFTAVAMTTAGAAVMVHFFLAIGRIPALPSKAYALIAVLALGATVLPAFIMAAGTGRVGAQGTAIVSSLSPIVTILLAGAVLDEPFGLPQALGTALVIGGVGWFTWTETRRARKPTARLDGQPQPTASDRAV
jgi:drug/metabolite transporter (DMT)-like permease